MALRTKTIEYAFAYSTAAVASNVARNFAAITVDIPETTDRTFRSVVLEFTAYDNATTAANATAVTMGVQVDSVAINTVAVTQTIANSAENQSFIFTRDATAYFQTNFTGTSHQVLGRLTLTGLGTVNTTCKIIITYEYNDTAQTTRVKTVKIPIDGNTGNLTTTLANIGGITNQFPALDTFLPEASKVYKDIFFESYAGTGSNSTVDTALILRLYGTTDLTSTVFESAFTTDRWVKRIDKLQGLLPTNAAYSPQARTGNANNPFACLSGVLTVTYTYDHSASTTIINSLQIPALDEAGWTGGPTTADRSRFRRTLFIQEPGPINLVQSGLLMSFIDAGSVTMDVRVGAQTSRTFTVPATVRAGCSHLSRRFDSGAAGSSANMVLQRGLNDITVDFFSSGTALGTLGSNISGLIFLNYTSGLHADGDGAHNHTTQWINRPYTTGGLVERLQYAPTTTPNIPENNWFLTSAGYDIKLLTSGTATATLGFSLQAKIQSGEGQGAGWADFYTGLYSSDAEVGPSLMWARARSYFKRYPNDQDPDRLNPEVVRDYRFDISQNAAGIWQCIKYLTYHNIAYTVSGGITGSAGGTVYLELYRTDTAELLDKTTRVGNGAYSFTWYDNTIDVIVVAYETDDLKGASAQNVASGGIFDIQLDAADPGPTYYAFSG
jgi:hypothetical protein